MLVGDLGPRAWHADQWGPWGLRELGRCGPEVSVADGMMHTRIEHHRGPREDGRFALRSTPAGRQVRNACHRWGHPPGLRPSQHGDARQSQRYTAGLRDHV